jgi:hypothetical protein
MGQVGLGDARAVVAYGELAGPQAHLDPRAGRAELGRVVQQVPDGDAERYWLVIPAYAAWSLVYFLADGSWRGRPRRH